MVIYVLIAQRNRASSALTGLQRSRTEYISGRFCGLHLRRAAQNQVQARVPLAADVPLAPQEGLLIVSHAAEEVTLNVNINTIGLYLNDLSASKRICYCSWVSYLVLTATGSVSDTLLLLSSAALHTALTPGLIRAEPPLAHIATAQTPGNQSVEFHLWINTLSTHKSA